MLHQAGHRTRSSLALAYRRPFVSRQLHTERLESRLAMAFGVEIMGEPIWMLPLNGDNSTSAVDSSIPADSIQADSIQADSIQTDQDTADTDGSTGPNVEVDDGADLSSDSFVHDETPNTVTDSEWSALDGEEQNNNEPGSNGSSSIQSAGPSRVEIELGHLAESYSLLSGSNLDIVIPYSSIRQEIDRGRTIPFALTVPSDWVDINASASVEFEERDVELFAVVRLAAIRDRQFKVQSFESAVADRDTLGAPSGPFPTTEWRLSPSTAGNDDSAVSPSLTFVRWNLHAVDLSDGMFMMFVTGPFSVVLSPDSETSPPPTSRRRPGEKPGGDGDPWATPQIASPGSPLSARSIAFEGRLFANGQALRTIDVAAIIDKSAAAPGASLTGAAPAIADGTSTPLNSSLGANESLRGVFSRPEILRQSNRRWTTSSESVVEASPFWARPDNSKALTSDQAPENTIRRGERLSSSDEVVTSSPDALNEPHDDLPTPSYVMTAMAWDNSRSSNVSSTTGDSPERLLAAATGGAVVQAGFESENESSAASIQETGSDRICHCLAAVDAVRSGNADSLAVAACVLALSTQAVLLRPAAEERSPEDSKSK